MAAPIIFAIQGVAIFIGFFLFVSLANIYVLVWALGEWGLIDTSWQDEFVGSLWGWTDDFAILNLFNDLLAIPF